MRRRRASAQKADGDIAVGDHRKRACSPAVLRWALPVVVAIISFVAFLPTLRNGFVTWDDDRNFLTNPAYRGLSVDNLKWMWSTFLLGHYVPLSWMTLGADYVVWGMQPSGYHLTNGVLHALNAVLVYTLGYRILRIANENASTKRVMICAAIGSLFFAIHPLRVESVAWITERRDLLSLFFALASLLAYLRFIRGNARSPLWYSTSLVLFACGLLSKATVVTLPVVLLLLNIYPLRRLGSTRVRRIGIELAPFAVLASAVVVLSIVALAPPRQLDLGGKLLVSSYSLWFYLLKTVVPTNLSPLYQMPAVISLSDVQFLLGVIGSVFVVCGVAFAARRSKGAFIALIAFIVVVAPMLGVVQNGPQLAADRYTYHASPALAFLLAGGLLHLWPRAARIVVPLTVVWLGVLGTLTWNQTRVWHDSYALWSRVLTVDSTSSIGHSSFASLEFERNDLESATRHSMLAVRYNSTSASAHVALGIAYARRGESDAATAEYRRALALNPRDDQAESNLGVALVQQGHVDEGIAHFTRALAINPSNSDAQVNWGNALVRANRPNEAIPHYTEALRIRPDLADAHFNWGVALARMQQFDAAIEQFRATLALNAFHQQAQAYIAKAIELAAGQRL